jgi:hypothetical protein
MYLIIFLRGICRCKLNITISIFLKLICRIYFLFFIAFFDLFNVSLKLASKISFTLDFFQTRQPIFAQLLGATFRVSQCSWLTLDQRLNVENCIRTLSEVAKSRDIPISPDLDIQVFKFVLNQVFRALKSKSM